MLTLRRRGGAATPCHTDVLAPWPQTALYALQYAAAAGRSNPGNCRQANHVPVACCQLPVACSSEYSCVAQFICCSLYTRLIFVQAKWIIIFLYSESKGKCRRDAYLPWENVSREYLFSSGHSSWSLSKYTLFNIVNMVPLSIKSVSRYLNI